MAENASSDSGRTFSLRTRYALFTYAQCGSLDPWAVNGLFSSLQAECIIGRENHSDGGIHLHVFVDFGSRRYFSGERTFDVEGNHPNVQPCGRTPAKMYDYAIKDGDVVAGGLERPADSGSSVDGAADAWARIASAGSADEFWELARELVPRALCTNFNSLKAYAEWNYRPERIAYVHPTSLAFDLSGVEALSEWVHHSLSGTGSGKCLAPPLSPSGGGIPTGGEPLPPPEVGFGAPEPEL